MEQFGQNLHWLIPLLVVDIVLKAISLWKSARNNQRYWFIFLTIINSLGILPLIYLLFFQKKVKVGKKQ